VRRPPRSPPTTELTSATRLKATAVAGVRWASGWIRRRSARSATAATAIRAIRTACQFARLRASRSRAWCARSTSPDAIVTTMVADAAINTNVPARYSSCAHGRASPASDTTSKRATSTTPPMGRWVQRGWIGSGPVCRSRPEPTSGGRACVPIEVTQRSSGLQQSEVKDMIDIHVHNHFFFFRREARWSSANSATSVP
jgi:hypothetical protein